MEASVLALEDTCIENDIKEDIVQQEFSKNIVEDKLNIHLQLFNRWLYLKNIGLSISNYLLENNYKTVVIYGMGDIGIRLYEELTQNGIAVKYAIDQKPKSIEARNRVKIVSPDNKGDDGIDLLIVSSIYYYDEVKKVMKKKYKCPIISIKELLWSV